MKGILRFALVMISLVAISALAAAENAAPTVAITWPQEGLTIASERIEVTATYQAAGDAAVAEVSLIVDGRMTASREIDPPQAGGSVAFVWAVGNYGAGTHEFTVRAVDSSGTVGEQTISVSVVQTREDLGPGIRITSPRPGQAGSGRMEVEVAPDEQAMVRYVIFLVDDVFKAMTNVQPFSYVWDTTRYLNGLHELQAKAYLVGGGEALSSRVEVTVDNPSGATAMREPARSPQAAPASAAVPAWPPARAGRPTMPAPMHTESPTATRPIITVSEPELGLPGTAPFVSATGELIRPPSPMTAESSQAQPVEIAALPADVAAPAAEEAVSPSPPAEASLSAIEQELSPVSAAAAEAPEARTPEPSPIEIALLSAEAPAPMPVAPPVRSASASIAAAAPGMSAPAVVASEPVPSSMQIAMLPPRPVERTPAPKLTAAPVSAETVYVVQAGDWLWQIASEYGVHPREIARANGLSDASVIQPGQRLVIPGTQVYFDNRPLRADAPTTIANGRAIVPFRPVIEEAGGSIVWQPVERRASAVARGHEIAVTAGSDQAQVDGSQIAMGAPAALRSNRMMVPLRFLGDALDLALQYEDGIIHIASGR
ncbi:MAG: stalk domain-containing protein [Armatimonadetes bacterium]|nr:stalk domain-containing protein [Armatimonadota bacterium]